MKQLTIKRLDGKYYICEDKEKKFFAIDVKEMPENAKLKDKIEIDDDGLITIIGK
ncbi:MAG: DUF3006 domain-containing protein [Clostridia bacterium]